MATRIRVFHKGVELTGPRGEEAQQVAQGYFARAGVDPWAAATAAFREEAPDAPTLTDDEYTWAEVWRGAQEAIALGLNVPGGIDIELDHVR